MSGEIIARPGQKEGLFWWAEGRRGGEIEEKITRTSTQLHGRKRIDEAEENDATRNTHNGQTEEQTAKTEKCDHAVWNVVSNRSGDIPCNGKKTMAEKLILIISEIDSQAELIDKKTRLQAKETHTTGRSPIRG